jgi:hypothetical protein
VVDGERPDSGAASNRDSPDASGHKIEALRALWKQSNSKARASGRGAEVRPVRCWLRAHGCDRTQRGSVRSVSGVFGPLMISGAQS